MAIEQAALVPATDSPALATQLIDQEAIIERGIKSFVEVGEALATIRDQRLYLATHKNFDAYLADRWPELGHRNYVHKMIRAACVAAELGTTVPIAAPASEWQVRPLLRLKTPEERQEAWIRAVESTAGSGRFPTARDVEAQVTQIHPPPPRPAHFCPHGMDLSAGDSDCCPLHARHYHKELGCEACRADKAVKIHPADAIRAEFALLADVASTLQGIEHRLTTLPMAELWTALGDAHITMAVDAVDSIPTTVVAIYDLLGAAEDAALAEGPNNNLTHPITQLLTASTSVASAPYCQRRTERRDRGRGMVELLKI
jgi:hypothetical protein